MPQSDKISSSNIKLVLGLSPGQSGARRLKQWLLILAVLAAAGLAALLLLPEKDDMIHYRTAELQRGDLVVRVTATGVLQPVNQVEVGTEISGAIDSVLVDFNDRVKRGDVLARLDTERLQAQVIQARASLQSANARVEEARATELETRVRTERCATLARKQLCSQEDLDTLKAAHTRARAGEASARAQVAVAGPPSMRMRPIWPGR